MVRSRFFKFLAIMILATSTAFAERDGGGDPGGGGTLSREDLETVKEQAKGFFIERDVFMKLHTQFNLDVKRKFGVTKILAKIAPLAKTKIAQTPIYVQEAPCP